MTYYSISEAANLAKVSQSVLRTWEEKYRWPRSTRTSQGFRQYDSAMIAEIILVRRLTNDGQHIKDLIDPQGFLKVGNEPKKGPSVGAQIRINTPASSEGASEVRGLMLDAVERRDLLAVLEILHYVFTLHPTDRIIIVSPVHASLFETWWDSPSARELEGTLQVTVDATTNAQAQAAARAIIETMRATPSSSGSIEGGM